MADCLYICPAPRAGIRAWVYWENPNMEIKRLAQAA